MSEATDTETFNQYTYKHKKNPVEVQVGDIVEYKIRVYNEGNFDARISKVTDYLQSTGLEYIPERTKIYGEEDDETTAFTIPKAITNSNTYKIEAVSDDTNGLLQIVVLSTFSDIKSGGIQDLLGKNALTSNPEPTFMEISLSFRVKEEAKGRILTNIAEVTEFGAQEDTDGDGNGDGEIVLVKDVDSETHNIREDLPTTNEEWENYKGNKANKDDLTDQNYYYTGQEDDDDFDKIYIPGEEQIDLALRKSIVTKNGNTQNRQRDPNTTPLKDGTGTTSEFSDIKDELTVKAGDKITYTIRVFNEGNQDGYATKITDYIPEGLGFLPNYIDNVSNGWVADSSGTVKKLSEITNATSHFSNSDFTGDGDYKDQNVICGKASVYTEKLKNTTLPKYDKTEDNLAIATIQITCVVLDTSEANAIIRNVAAITGYADKNKTTVTDDRDSKSNNDLTNFNENSHEDDEDYEKLIFSEDVLPYDLALKKFVSSVTDATNTSKTIPSDQKRNLSVTNIDALKNRTDATTKADATYTFGLDKEPNPVRVEKGDYVTYTIRIYNEGLIDGKVTELVDSVPEGLTFLPESETNKKYGWTEFKDGKTGWQSGVKTTYLKDTVIPAFDATKEGESNYDSTRGTGIDKGVSFAEVKIEFKVNDKAKTSQAIKNLAEITEDDNDDNDSTPNNEKLEEDDEDFDVIIPGRFDLALRKFITQIGDTKITDRVPKVDTTELDAGTSTTAKYTHPKEEDIKVVVKGQVVVYTIRVYNEGNQDGYVSEIKDDIPEGLKFLPDNEINKTNKWKMYDASGNETDDITKAIQIRTDAKSKANGTEKSGEGDPTNPYYKSNTNLIKAYDSTTMKNGPDYVEVQVAFEVTKENVTDGKTVIINTAEITKETDDEGNNIADDDSTPDNNKDGEDDIDKEYLQLKYFDLSLLKYVTKVIVTEDGVTKETETGYDGTENPEPVVKVELNKKKLAQTEVKYIYTIKITNEGQIEGYAKEVKDRIPNGLAFYEEDNTQYNWKIKSEGIVTTDYLKDKLLKPGESATVPLVLRWENSESNLGQKVNVAEISKDENEYGIPDIDSTPDNNKDGEDDQDEAIVVLSIDTGSTPLYIMLITIVTAIIGTGLYLIYKYVIKK